MEDHHESCHPTPHRVTPTDAEATARMFDIMLGDDLPGRKQYIADHGAEYIKDADI